ncbi:hypothetical protein ACSBR1_029549 [Camellia fascicularis]
MSWLMFLLHQFLLLFLLSSSSSSTCARHTCLEDQRFSLLQFKTTFTITANASLYCGSGSHIPKMVFWNESSDCCSWEGVTCDWSNGHVIGLDLSCSQLQGTIQPNSTLFHLRHLQTLNLAFNDFNFSTISPDFGSFPSLTHLNLSFSHFTGRIPSKISHLIKMPETYVVHLGNSKELMEVAENSVAKRVLREHVRESLGVQNEDLLFAAINSVSRGKGQDLFLRSFHESLQLIQEKKLQVPSLHAVIVGSDMNAQTKFETELCNFVAEKKIQDCVHFVNKTLNVAPYLASIDVLVQNSQAQGECFGRITIEAMAFQQPVLGTAAGGTMEIVVNGTTGWLHQAGKEGVTPLAENIVKMATHVERRLTMGKKGYEMVKERFMEHHMSQRIALVLKEVLRKSNSRT